MQKRKNDSLMSILRNSPRNFRILLLGLLSVKTVLHLLCIGNYELHRDAYLYLSFADHLDFGFLSVPPLIGFVGWILEVAAGQNRYLVGIAALFPGLVIIVFLAAIVRRLGGETRALLFAGLSFIFSVAFLRTNSLFQPVGFNQMFWVMVFFCWLAFLQDQQPRQLAIAALISGLAFWNKYSIVFLVLALLIATLMSNRRKILFCKETLIIAGMGLLIILPNLIWQHLHNWPVIHHMVELRQTQLVNVSVTGFLIAQLQMNGHALLIWVLGIWYLLRGNGKQELRPLAYAFFALLLILLTLSGKAYYTLGIYPPLFAAGGVALENLVRKWARGVSIVIAGVIVFSALPLLPMGLPLLPPAKMAQYGNVVSNYGLEGLLRWEDGQQYDLPQDFADMLGWKKISLAVHETCRKTTLEMGQAPLIFAGNYGLAGAIRYYDHSRNLPQIVSFSDTYLLWAPDSLDSKQRIWLYVDDVLPQSLQAGFREIKPLWRLDQPLARQHGTTIYLCIDMVTDAPKKYRELVAELKGQFGQGVNYRSP